MKKTKLLTGIALLASLITHAQWTISTTNTNNVYWPGNAGVGTSQPTQRLHVDNGGIMISGQTPGYGGPQLIFSSDITNTPYGEWAIEYLTATADRPSMGGLNFWKPTGYSGQPKNYTLFLKDNGKIGMGVSDDRYEQQIFCENAFRGKYRLYVNGGILTTKVKVANYCSDSWADYVFADDYELKQLSEVEAYIKENKHLPGIPSAQAVESDGLDLAEIASKQMAKIEELTLYLIRIEKDMQALKADNDMLKAALKQSYHH